MTYLRPIHKGEVLPGYPTEAHNAFYRVWQEHSLQPPGGGPPGTGRGSEAVEVQIKNTSGALIDTQFPVLKISGLVFDFDDNNQAIFGTPVLTGITPDSSTDITNIAIVQGPIPNNAVRRAIIQGATWCRVNVTNANHTHAKPAASDDEKLVSDAGVGARILWKQSGTGTKVCYLMVGGGGGKTSYVGYTIEAIPAGTGTYDARTPGIGDGTVFKGDGPATDWRNYSLVEIPEHTICVVEVIGGDPVIKEAFC
jgi:hypothetical protein